MSATGIPTAPSPLELQPAGDNANASFAAPEAPASFLERHGTEVLALLRVVLALGGLIAVQLEPSVGRHATVTLLFYLLHACIALVHGAYRQDLLRARYWHWLDLAWCIALISVSGGKAIFYFFILYPVGIAAFRRGSGEGLSVLATAIAGCLLIPVLQASGLTHPPQWRDISLRCGLLLLFGLPLALGAGLEGLQRKRLALIGRLNHVPNARFGPAPLITATLQRLRDFYRAENCIAVMTGDDGPSLYVADATEDLPSLLDEYGPALLRRLLALPPGCTVISTAPRPWAHPLSTTHRLGDINDADDGARGAALSASRALNETFATAVWCSVPLELRGVPLGRLYLLAPRDKVGPGDIRLLQQAMEQLMPLVETVELLDGWASGAAEMERRKISLDLHDSTIQPYLGLKLGLESLRRKLDAHNPLRADVDELCRMTTESLAELRSQVRGLGSKPLPRSALLMEGARRQARLFGSFYGIEVTLNFLTPLNLNDRLSAEILQMIGEGLSNIGRHTRSRHATLNLSCRDQNFVVEIIDHAPEEQAPPCEWRSFTPESLSRRARQIGGWLTVAARPEGGSLVRIDVPL